jgi:hypothetical protein
MLTEGVNAPTTDVAVHCAARLTSSRVIDPPPLCDAGAVAADLHLQDNGQGHASRLSTKSEENVWVLPNASRESHT